VAKNSKYDQNGAHQEKHKSTQPQEKRHSLTPFEVDHERQRGWLNLSARTYDFHDASVVL